MRDSHVVTVVGRQRIADFAHLASVRQEIAGNRLVRAILKLNTGQISEILNRHTTFDSGDAIDERGTLRALAALFLRQIVFVANVADQLLRHILQRDDAVGTAIFVDDHRQMNATLTQQFKAWQQLRRARQRNAFARHVGDRLRLGIANVEQIAHVHKAEHVIEILAGHRITGVWHFAHVRGRIPDRHGTIQKYHVGAWTHHFRHNRFGCVEHVIENRTLVLA